MTMDDAATLVEEEFLPRLKGRNAEDTIKVVSALLGLCQCVLTDEVGTVHAVRIITEGARDNASRIAEFYLH